MNHKEGCLSPALRGQEANLSVQGAGKRGRRWPLERILVGLWAALGLAMVGTTPVSAPLVRDTLPFVLLGLFLLALCALAPLVGLVLWILRRSVRPFLWCASSWIVAPMIYLAVLQIPHYDLLDAIRGEPEIVAVYVGTMNDLRLTFRKKGRFDELSTGLFGGRIYREGRYERHGREFRMRYQGDRSTEPPRRAFLVDGQVDLDPYGRLPRLSLQAPDSDRFMDLGILREAYAGSQ